MEPYFITSSDAPLMSDIYAGYGRDKCAYSRDLHAAGYKVNYSIIYSYYSLIIVYISLGIIILLLCIYKPMYNYIIVMYI